jgi:hypothetical protein
MRELDVLLGIIVVCYTVHVNCLCHCNRVCLNITCIFFEVGTVEIWVVWMVIYIYIYIFWWNIAGHMVLLFMYWLRHSYLHIPTGVLACRSSIAQTANGGYLVFSAGPPVFLHIVPVRATLRAQSGKVVSPTQQPTLSPSKSYTWYSFLIEAALIPGPQCCWRIKSTKNPNDPIGNRTRGLKTLWYTCIPTAMMMATIRNHRNNGNLGNKGNCVNHSSSTWTGLKVSVTFVKF